MIQVAVALFSLPAIAALGLWLWRPTPAASRRASIAVAAVMVALASLLVGAAARGEVVAFSFGGWRPPYGVAFAIDRLAALFAILHSLLLLATLLALRPKTHGDTVVRRAHPLLLLLSTGLIGAFMTADLFNLFVMFELVLVASYLLLQIPGTDRSLVSALPSIVVNVIASALFLAALGVLYGLCGSLSLAELPARLADAPADPRRVALAMLVIAFGTKAAFVPLCFWMPATYPTLSAPIAALFAGIMTKLGVYALLRILPLLELDPLIPELLVWTGGLSAIMGVLAALSQYEVRRLLSFHSVSQVGYMVVGIGFGTPIGVASAAFFAIHHSLVKSSLYLVADELERRNRSRDLRDMHFLRSGTGALAVGFGVAAFSLAGIPPLSGFFGKLGIFRAAFEADAWASLTLLVLASVFTLASMLKIWRFSFQQSPVASENVDNAPPARAFGLAMLTALILGLGLLAGPAFEYSEAAAHQLLDGGDYREALIAIPGLPEPVGGAH